MRRFLSCLSALALVFLFSNSVSAGFPGEAWLAPERCTEMVETSNGGDPPKRMEFFVDDIEYLESQWEGYGEQLQKLGRAEGVMRYRGEEMYDAYFSDYSDAPDDPDDPLDPSSTVCEMDRVPESNDIDQLSRLSRGRRVKCSATSVTRKAFRS